MAERTQNETSPHEHEWYPTDEPCPWNDWIGEDLPWGPFHPNHPLQHCSTCGAKTCLIDSRHLETRNYR
jgi:hypothetical protein